MGRLAILLELLVTCMFVNSVFANSLYEGGWRIPDGDAYYTLVWPELKEAKTFALNCVEIVDEKYARFSIIVDGKQIIAPLGEAGGAFVSGKTVSIQKSSPGSPHHCTWKIVEYSNVHERKVQWFVRQNMQEVLLGAFSNRDVLG